MKLVASTLALFAAISAFAAPAAAAAAAPTEHAVQADLNGDGTMDRVVVKSVPGNPNEQLLVATVGRVNYVAREPFFGLDAGVQPLRVVDLNADGRDEVLLTEEIGAHTDVLSVWGLFDGWRPMKMPDQSRLRLFEGGAVYSFDKFGCDTIAGQRKLVTVSGWLDEMETDIYTGRRITYSVGFGAVEQWSYMEVSGPRDAPVFRVAPQACE